MDLRQGVKYHQCPKTGDQQQEEEEHPHFSSII